MKIIHQRIRALSCKVIFSSLKIPWIEKDCPEIWGIEPLECIPAGTYKCIPYFSPKRQEDCWLLEDVPGFSFIEIHAGNFACDIIALPDFVKSNTNGCLMYGFDLNTDIPMLLNSKRTLEWLHDTIGLKSTFEIEIRN